MKRVSDCQEPVVVEPPAPEPVEAQAALRTAPVEARDEADVEEAPPDGTESHDRELPLQLRVFGPEGKELLDSGGTQTALVELADNLVGRIHHAVEVNDLDLDAHHTLALHGEVISGDIVVLPVVPSDRDHLREGKTVVDGDGVGGADALRIRQERSAKHPL